MLHADCSAALVCVNCQPCSCIRILGQHQVRRRIWCRDGRDNGLLDPARPSLLFPRAWAGPEACSQPPSAPPLPFSSLDFICFCFFVFVSVRVCCQSISMPSLITVTRAEHGRTDVIDRIAGKNNYLERDPVTAGKQRVQPNRAVIEWCLDLRSCDPAHPAQRPPGSADA